MKVKILIGVLLLLIAVNLATIGSYVYLRFKAPSYPRIVNRMPMMGPRFNRMRGRRPMPMLRLNHNQRQQLFKLLHDFRQETQPERRQIHILERKTFRMMQQNPVPMDSVNENLKQISNVRYEISQKIIKKLMAAKSYLTPRQQHAFYNAIMRARVEQSNMPPSQAPGKSQLPLP